jgi:hypothetical protein
MKLSLILLASFSYARRVIKKEDDGAAVPDTHQNKLKVFIKYCLILNKFEKKLPERSHKNVFILF